MLVPQRVPHPSDRLDTLFRVIRVVRSIPDLDSVLEVLMDHLLELLGAERGFIMLMDEGLLAFRKARNFTKEDLFGDDFQVSRSIVYQVFHSGQAVLTSNAQEDERFQAAPSVQAFGLRAIMCAPIATASAKLGVLYVDNSMQMGAFEEEDRQFLQTFADQAATALERGRLADESRRVRELFSRYVSPHAVDEILARPSEALTAVRRRVTVMMSDLRGFSAMSERLPPDELLHQLNEYYEEMGEVIFSFDGTLLSFLGDGILAVFGAPLAAEGQEQRAIWCARQMVQRAWESKKMRMGVGLATGEAVMGDLGSARQRVYTVIGDPVNTAARLEKLTKTKNHPVLCDTETYRGSGLADGWELGAAQLAGKTQAVTVWAV